MPRAIDANKGHFGHVLVIGGDYGMPGAVRLAAEAAARIGAGLVTVATRPEHVISTITGRPELLCYGLESLPLDLEVLIAKATVIVLGPGLGQSTWSQALFNTLLQAPLTLPLIIDADGLNWLAKTTPSAKREHWILTPHPGEAARLLNVSTAYIQANREKCAQLLQQRYGGTIVLKGAGTLIAAKDKPITHCLAGNPGMASAGMGDLLTGMIAGLIAQDLDNWHAAQAGVLFHAVAGDRAVLKRGQRGLLASDLFDELPALINP